MSVRVRLTRVGSKKNPIWRVVVTDKRSPRDGRFIEQIGHYNPRTEPSTILLDRERLDHWIALGAEPTNTVKKLMRGRAPEVAEPETEPADASAAEATTAEVGETEPADDAAADPAGADAESGTGTTETETGEDTTDADAETHADTDASGDAEPGESAEAG